MGTRKSESTEERPEILLGSWSVYETENGDHHFVGLDLMRREGRVSSRIVAYDLVKRVGYTASGRSYKLCGKPSHNVDAQYTWNKWKRMHNVSVYRDISDTY